MANLNLFEGKVKVSQKPATNRKEEIKRILEALLFSSNEPITLAKLKEIVSIAYPVKTEEIKSSLKELKLEYLQPTRAFQLDEIGEGYLLRTKQDLHSFVEHLHQNRRSEKLSKAATEILAIIAYKQPITRAEIEKIRAVDSTGTIAALLERGLIEVVGRLDAPGRPSQYGITKQFLQHFGLNSIQDLVT